MALDTRSFNLLVDDTESDQNGTAGNLLKKLFLNQLLNYLLYNTTIYQYRNIAFLGECLILFCIPLYNVSRDIGFQINNITRYFVFNIVQNSHSFLAILCFLVINKSMQNRWSFNIAVACAAILLRVVRFYWQSAVAIRWK